MLKRRMRILSALTISLNLSVFGGPVAQLVRAGGLKWFKSKCLKNNEGYGVLYDNFDKEVDTFRVLTLNHQDCS